MCAEPISSDVLRFAKDVGAASDRVPCRCPNEGCEVMLPSHEIHQHAIGACSHYIVDCPSREEGCTFVGPRRLLGDHLFNDCSFRSVACPQRCGESLPARLLDDHIADSCLKSLVACPNRCGQDVERGLLADHESVCAIKPVACPYARFGCELRGNLTREQLGHHMATSIHAHLLLIDRYTNAHAAEAAAAQSLLARRPLHVWDPGYIQVVERWSAQQATIRAVAIVGRWLISGCDRGSLMALDINTGLQVKTIEAAGCAPVCSLCAVANGRLVVAFTDCSLQLWESTADEPLVRKVLTQRVYPTQHLGPNALLSLAAIGLSKRAHINASRRHLLHTELYAVPPMTDQPPIDEHMLDIIAVGCGGEVLLFTLDTLELVSRICLKDRLSGGPLDGVRVTALASLSIQREPRTGLGKSSLLVAASDGSLLSVDLGKMDLPHRFLSVPFDEATTSICVGLSSGKCPSLRIGLGGAAGSVALCTVADTCSADLEVLLHVAQAHKAPVRCVTSADGKHLVSGAEDETTKIWAIPHQLPVREIPTSVYCGAVAHQLLFSGGTQGGIRVITATTCRTETM